MKNKKKIILVGGGISSLVFATFLSKDIYDVSIIEKEHKIGGLLKSEVFNNLYFDYGTHLLKETGNSIIDKKLFGDITDTYYNILPLVKSGTVSNNTINTNNGFIDARTLPKDLFLQGREELLSNNIYYEFNNDLQEYLIKNYGSTFTQYLLKPAIEKLTKSPIQNLNLKTLFLYGLNRIIIGEGDEIKKLKENKIYDNKIAYGSYYEGISNLKSFYPKNFGIGSWVTALENNLRHEGVKILTNTNIEKIESEGDKISKVIITENVLSCDYVIWTAPSIVLLQKYNYNLSKLNLNRPQWLDTTIINCVADKPYDKDLFYFQNYDPKDDYFRVTLYDNITKSTNKNFTIETFHEPNQDRELDIDSIFEKVSKYIYRDEKVNLTNSTSIKIKNSFPILTNQFIDDNLKINNLICNLFSNVHLLGKSAGNSFFMNDVIIESFNESQKLNNVI